MTNASRTMLFNIHTLEWDEELLQLFDIPTLDAAGGGGVQRALRDDRRVARGYSDRRASRATSRRRCSGRCARRRGWRSARSAPGAFMLLNTGEKPVHLEEPAADDDRVADWRLAWSMRWKAAC